MAVSRRRPAHRNVVTSREAGDARLGRALAGDTDKQLSRRGAGLAGLAALAGLTLAEAMPLNAMAAGEKSFYDFTVSQYGQPFALVRPRAGGHVQGVGKGRPTRIMLFNCMEERSPQRLLTP
jgi:hypothetical protein